MPYDAKHWRERAAEAREIAKGLSLNEAKRRMHAIAEHYDRLAEQEERSKNRRDRS
jgi:hypothetical protein